MKHKILLCGYHQPGIDICEYLVGRSDVSDLPVLTYLSTIYSQLLDEFAAKNNLWCSCERMDHEKLPFQPDVIVSIWYRNIFLSDFLSNFSGVIFNAHPSLLLKDRGYFSVLCSIINGESSAGVNYRYMDAGIDAGNVVAQIETPTLINATLASLYPRHMELAVGLSPSPLDFVLSEYEGRGQRGFGSYYKRGVPFDRVNNLT
jgi:methionyl-tRNA formyltransferase